MSRGSPAAGPPKTREAESAVAGEPVVFRYQQALDEFRREGREPPLLKRMSELISLLDLTTTLSSNLSGEQILDAALLIVMGELQAPRGALFVRGESGQFQLRASRGLPDGFPSSLVLELPADAGVLRSGAGYDELLGGCGLEMVSPVFRAGRCIALLGVGARSGGQPFSQEDSGFLASVAACAATPIENGLIYGELERLNQRLSVKVFQLNNLFDISRELTASFDEETIKSLVTTTLMGHLMVSRCGLYLVVPGGLAVAHERGIPSHLGGALVPEGEARPLLDALTRPLPVAELPDGSLKERLARGGLALAAPLSLGEEMQGFVAAGERVSGVPFSAEDHDFILMLGRQALAALESVRLHRVRVEKQRQDRELQIAREIQQSLFPDCCPRIPGFDVAAHSRACYQVGGDHYDFIPLGEQRLALAIADVSGKSTPAAILMASIHASLRALAGSEPPEVLAQRINAFLHASTQANKYVTMFYAELDVAAHTLCYVNAGHVPPVLLRRRGDRQSLGVGGPALGMLEGACYEAAEVSLGSGDLVAMMTDGVTEALSADEQEFGEERAVASLLASLEEPAGCVLDGLVAAVNDWTGPAGSSDDLTALILKAS